MLIHKNLFKKPRIWKGEGLESRRFMLAFYCIFRWKRPPLMFHLSYQNGSKVLTLSLPVPRWAGHNTDLPSDSNISKTVRVNIAFAATFFKEYSTSFLMVCRLIDFALVVLKLLMFKVCVIIGISKIKFFNFFGTERVKYFVGKILCIVKPPAGRRWLRH